MLSISLFVWGKFVFSLKNINLYIKNSKYRDKTLSLCSKRWYLIMKYLLLILFVSISFHCNGKDFDGMLKDVMDSAYKYAIEFYDSKNIFYYKRSMPYKFKTSDFFEEREVPKRTTRKVYIGDYDVHLGKDTLFVESFMQQLYKDNDSFYRHNFSRLKWHKYPYATAIGIIYIYDKQDKSWVRAQRIKDFYARWYTEVSARKRQRLIDLENESLVVFLQNLKTFKNDSSFLVIDDSFGAQFFLWEYKDKPFGYMVAAQGDLSNKVLKKYKILVGWCSVGLEGNTLSFQLRAVDSDKYKKLADKTCVDETVLFTQIFHFRYCDIHKKWCMVEEKQNHIEKELH